MKVFLANPRGFCAGVNRAIAIVNQAIELHGAPVYVLHEIVHNTHVIEELRGKGAVFVEELEEIPRRAVVIFSAHGVSLAVKEKAHQLGLRTIDAICPLVETVHKRVRKLNSINYDVIVIGHKGHPEVEGTCGHAIGRVHVLSSVEEVEQLLVDDETKVGYVTQTTLSVDDTRDILAALKVRFPLITAPKRTDICYATTSRQVAVRRLAQQVELVLVVGSKNSSNSNRLREVAKQQNVPAYLIDHAGEIEPKWLDNIQVVGLTAGASAPEHLVSDVIHYLKTNSEDELVVVEMEGEKESVRFQIPDLAV